MNSETLGVRFVPRAYSFVETPDTATLWTAPERFCIGVYLWCVPLDDGYLINYVGKTSAKTGFHGRLRTEFRDWRAGRYIGPVDIQSFKRGRRVVLEFGDEAERARQIERQREEFAPLYRILLAPLRDDRECRHVENTIVHRMRQQPATFQFISNRDRDTRYRPAVAPAVAFESALPILGLTAPVPAGLGE